MLAGAELRYVEVGNFVFSNIMLETLLTPGCICQTIIDRRSQHECPFHNTSESMILFLSPNDVQEIGLHDWIEAFARISQKT
jgi:hypothetical protein